MIVKMAAQATTAAHVLHNNIELGKRPLPWGYSAFATKAIAAGEDLVQVPRARCLVSQELPPELQAWPPIYVAAMRLMLEMYKDKSGLLGDHAAVLRDVLRAGVGNVPCWGPAQVQALRGTAIEHLAASMPFRQRFREKVAPYMRAHPELYPPACVHEDSFLACVSLVKSRCFGGPSGAGAGGEDTDAGAAGNGSGSGEAAGASSSSASASHARPVLTMSVPMLVPLIDYCNHAGRLDGPAGGGSGAQEGASGASGQAKGKDKTSSAPVPPPAPSGPSVNAVVAIDPISLDATLRSTAPIAPGQQVFISYGRLPDAKLLGSYGFVLPPGGPGMDSGDVGQVAWNGDNDVRVRPRDIAAGLWPEHVAVVDNEVEEDGAGDRAGKKGVATKARGKSGAGSSSAALASGPGPSAWISGLPPLARHVLTLLQDSGLLPPEGVTVTARAVEAWEAQGHDGPQTGSSLASSPDTATNDIVMPLGLPHELFTVLTVLGWVKDEEDAGSQAASSGAGAKAKAKGKDKGVSQGGAGVGKKRSRPTPGDEDTATAASEPAHGQSDPTAAVDHASSLGQFLTLLSSAAAEPGSVDRDDLLLPTPAGLVPTAGSGGMGNGKGKAKVGNDADDAPSLPDTIPVLRALLLVLKACLGRYPTTVDQDLASGVLDDGEGEPEDGDGEGQGSGAAAAKGKAAGAGSIKASTTADPTWPLVLRPAGPSVTRACRLVSLGEKLLLHTVMEGAGQALGQVMKQVRGLQAGTGARPAPGKPSKSKGKSGR